MNRDEEGLIELLEKVMMEAKEPLDCNELFEKPEIRQHAASANRVSDYLGNLWRKGKLSRIPASAPGRGPKWKTKVFAGTESYEYIPKIVASRPTMLISEHGDQIQIELADLTIIIKQKKHGSKKD